MRLLLDTCTLLWLTQDADDLSARARELIVSPSNELVLSSASVWELAVESALGRVRFDRPFDEWVLDVREAYGLLPLNIDDEAAAHLLRLPPLHRDPFDRMLVAQALVHGLVILTPDAAIREYPARTLW
jgi:PIN domain nuclease of toxin-antitoxin system